MDIQNLSYFPTIKYLDMQHSNTTLLTEIDTQLNQIKHRKQAADIMELSGQVDSNVLTAVKNIFNTALTT